MKICSRCGAQNRDVACFCLNCARPLVSELICSNCATHNPTLATFCLNCATPLRGPTLMTGLTGMLRTNTVLSNRYAIVHKLGRGGMAVVYLVNDSRLVGKQWAVKEMSDAGLVDPAEKQKAIAAFQQEARLLARLNHQNLTKVVDYFEENNKHYLVIDFVDGQTLDYLLTLRNRPFPEAQVLYWAVQLCKVLSYLHHQSPSIIFRDLKPSNIMIEEKSGAVKLIDFGIARLFKPGQSRDTANFGTAGYAPPEQYGRGQSDARSDIYALGATLHHLLTLRDPAEVPFHFPQIGSLNASVSTHVEAVIGQATEHRPVKRWSSTNVMKNALQQAGFFQSRAKNEKREPQSW